jgi:beta-xylosidase
MKNSVVFYIVCIIGLILSTGCFSGQNLRQYKEIFFADPTVFYEDGKYYMTGTRNIKPLGFTLLESSDLKNWKKCASNPSGMILQQGHKAYGNDGFWAPQILKENNIYYLTYTADEHIALGTSLFLGERFTQKETASIDPSEKNIDSFIFKDDDGKYYLYHVRFNKGNYLWVGEFDLTKGKIVPGTLKQCFTNTELWENTPAYKSAPIMEGPTVIKKNGVYYLFYSANHFKSVDYAVGYATSSSPYGPWKKYSGNPIIHRTIVHENGSGHGDLFFDKNNNPFYVYHVHNSDSTIVPRKTRIIPLEFKMNKKTDIYDISVLPDKIIRPKTY